MGAVIDHETYEKAEKFFYANFKSLGEWNHYYILKDCLLGIDILLTMQRNIYIMTGLDLLFIRGPGFKLPAKRFIR